MGEVRLGLSRILQGVHCLIMCGSVLCYLFFSKRWLYYYYFSFGISVRWYCYVEWLSHVVYCMIRDEAIAELLLWVNVCTRVVLKSSSFSFFFGSVNWLGSYWPVVGSTDSNGFYEELVERIGERLVSNRPNLMTSVGLFYVILFRSR